MKQLIAYLLDHAILDFSGDLTLDMVRDFLRDDETPEGRKLLAKLVPFALATEAIERRTAAQWRSVEATRFDKRPALFLLQAAPRATKARSGTTR